MGLDRQREDFGAIGKKFSIIVESVDVSKAAEFSGRQLKRLQRKLGRIGFRFLSIEDESASSGEDQTGQEGQKHDLTPQEHVELLVESSRGLVGPVITEK